MTTTKKGTPPPDPDKKHQDELLDEALKETFPASDPAAIDIETPEDERQRNNSTRRRKR